MDYLPTAEDITEELPALAITKDVEGASFRLNIAKEKLQRLIRVDPDAIDLIRAAQAEFEAYLNLRALLLGPTALDTLERAMEGKFYDSKEAMAAVRAAESILDRTSLPKITRREGAGRQPGKIKALPDLNDLVEKAETDEKAREVADQYRDLLRQVDAMRRGAKEVIEGEAIDVSPP